MAQKRKHTAEFKTKVVLEALQERATVSELAQRYELHPNVIGMWKKQFLENASSVFGKPAEPDTEDVERERDALFKKVGQLQLEVDFLKKVSAKLGVSPKGGKW